MSSKTTQSRQQDINWKTKEEWEAIGYKIIPNNFPREDRYSKELLWNKNQVTLKLPDADKL